MSTATQEGPAHPRGLSPRGAPVSVLAQGMVPLGGPAPSVLVHVRQLADRLAGPGEPMSQEERVAVLAELERLKNVCAGAQAALTVDLDEQAALDRQASEGELGHRRREREGVTLEVALARRVSPQRSRSLIGLARTLHDRLPHTLEAFRDGRVSEWAASLVVREMQNLEDGQAREVDARLAPVLGTCSEGRLARKAASLAYETDRRGFVQRHARAVKDRYVSIRPAAEGMVRLSGLLPLVEGVAVHAALDQHARSARAAGAAGAAREDLGAARRPGDRTSAREEVPTVAQLRADELVRRITGVDPRREGMPVEIGLVMTDRSLADEGQDSARVPGYGPVPAVLARMIAATGSTRGGEVAAARAWLRRVFLDPVDSTVEDVDRRRRLFTGPLRRFVLTRDQECAMPRCSAPIQDVDHVTRARDGGPTSAANGQGTCRSCNLDKEAEGVETEVTKAPDGTRAIRIRTRYGQTHHTRPPPVLDTLDDLAARWHGARPPWWAGTDRADEPLTEGDHVTEGAVGGGADELLTERDQSTADDGGGGDGGGGDDRDGC